MAASWPKRTAHKVRPLRMRPATNTVALRILRHCRVDVERPLVDAAGHVLGLREAVLPQPLDDPQAAAAVMAMYDDRRVAVRFQLGLARGDLAHRNERRGGDLRRSVLFRLANVEQQELFAGVEPLLNGATIDFDGNGGGGH